MKILETRRLILRRLVPDDLHNLFALYRDPEIRRYFPEGTLTLEETKEELEWFLNGHPEHSELGLWATIHKETGAFIGRCGLLPWTIEWQYEVEVAYLIAKDYWGQGLGTEAAQGVLQYGFDQLGLSRLICLIDQDNQASRKVAGNIGMRFEKEIEDKFGRCMVYAIAKQRIDRRGVAKPPVAQRSGGDRVGLNDNMPESTDQLLQRARAIMPDLVIESAERNQEGLVNDVLIINKQYVFRIAKTDAYAKQLETELKMLDLIRPQIGLSVPTPIHRNPGSVVYPFLSGQPLTRKMVMTFDESTQKRVAEQLGTFLYRLHTIDVSALAGELPATRAPVRRQDWLNIREGVNAKIVPLLLPHQIEWLIDLFDSVLENPEMAEYKPALIHGDLASYHILFDAQQNQITGVIDFGVAGLGDAASDIGGLINVYGESFVQKMRAVYPTLDNYLPRARFYAQLLELEWVLNGLETGEMFWFTAHLGGARDIWG